MYYGMCYKEQGYAFFFTGWVITTDQIKTPKMLRIGVNIDMSLQMCIAIKNTKYILFYQVIILSNPGLWNNGKYTMVCICILDTVHQCIRYTYFLEEGSLLFSVNKGQRHMASYMKCKSAKPH